MKKRWIILSCALLLAAATMVMVHHRNAAPLSGFAGARQPALAPMPVYQGKSAEQWLQGAQTNSLVDMMRAFNTMGTNTIPVGLRAYQLRDSALTKMALGIYPHLPPFLKKHFAAPTSVEFMWRAAPWALGNRRSVLPQLMALLKERNNPARYYILQQAVPPLGPADKDYAPVLISLLRDADVKVRVQASEGLRKIGPDAKEAIPALTIAVKDSDAQMRLVSAWALWRIDFQTNLLATTLSEAIQSGQGSKCSDYCGHVLDEANPTDHAFIPVLTNLLGGANAGARVTAARILGKYDLAGREAIPALAKAAESGDPSLRTVALSSLKRIDPDAAAKYQSALTQTNSP